MSELPKLLNKTKMADKFHGSSLHFDNRDGPFALAGCLDATTPRMIDGGLAAGLSLTCVGPEGFNVDESIEAYRCGFRIEENHLTVPSYVFPQRDPSSPPESRR